MKKYRGLSKGIVIFGLPVFLVFYSIQINVHGVHVFNVSRNPDAPGFSIHFFFKTASQNIRDIHLQLFKQFESDTFFKNLRSEKTAEPEPFSVEVVETIKLVQASHLKHYALVENDFKTSDINDITALLWPIKRIEKSENLVLTITEKLPVQCRITGNATKVLLATCN